MLNFTFISSSLWHRTAHRAGSDECNCLIKSICINEPRLHQRSIATELSNLSADSGWGEDPERFFGHVTVKVDPGKDDYTPRSQSGKAGNDDDEEDDDDSFSDVSGIDDEDDEVPFGPARTVAGEPGQSKSLEILRQGSYHGGDVIPQAGNVVRLYGQLHWNPQTVFHLNRVNQLAVFWNCSSCTQVLENSFRVIVVWCAVSANGNAV